MQIFYLLVGAILTSFTLCPTSSVTAAEKNSSEQLGFVKGFTWGWDGRRGDYCSQAARDSMTTLAELGCDWVCISFATSMRSFDNPQFYWSERNPRMVSDQDILAAIKLARAQDLKVILKPVVNCRDGVWRAWIRFFRPLTHAEKLKGIEGEYDPWGESPGMRKGFVRDENKWSQWWDNYSSFLSHYAKIAEDEQVELFCIGCEMSSTEDQEQQWREIVQEVESIYQGPLIYNANHGREAVIGWWDAVDLVGISAYYPVPAPSGQTIEDATQQDTKKTEIVETLRKVNKELTTLHHKFKKPILFIESGVTSVRGASRYPWSYPESHPENPVSQVEQANYYVAMLEVFWNEPWFAGFAWWDWPVRLYPLSDAATNRDFCVHGKQAENVLRKWYAQPRLPGQSP